MPLGLEDEIMSPGLEWDDGGCELGHRSVAAADCPESEDGEDTGQTEQILEDIEKFENSIFRRDMDTGSSITTKGLPYPAGPRLH